MTPISIKAAERGLVRVFALSLPDAEAKAIAEDKSGQLPKLLGVPSLDVTECEIFAVSDLDDLGLSGYLTEGHDIEEAMIATDKAKLSALGGWVMIVRSAAFKGQDMDITPGPEVVLIGTYQEPGVDWTEGQDLKSVAALEPAAHADKRPSDAAMSGRIATYALIFIFLFTALIIWIAA